MSQPTAIFDATFVATIAVSQPVAAFVDEKTGLAVEPAAPYQATAGTPRPNYDVVVSVRSSTGKPTAAGPDGNLCGVAFKLVPQNAGLTQPAINDRITKPDWIETVQAPFKTWGNIERTETFEQEGLKGVELVVAPKAGPGHETVRMSPCGKRRRAVPSSRAPARPTRWPRRWTPSSPSAARCGHPVKPA